MRYENTCQNACVYCDSDLSSRWAKELGVEQVRPGDNKMHDTKQYIIEKLSGIKEIYLAGGEPLVSKDFAVILKELHYVNPGCKVRVNSNIKNLQTPVYELTKQFNNLQYTISMESTGSQFEYIRWPQKWDSFVTNFKQIRTEVPKYNLNMVLNVLNHRAIFDSIDYLLGIGVNENAFIITHAYEPDWMNITNLPEDMLLEFKVQCKMYMRQCDPRLNLYSALQGCIGYIDDSNDVADISLTQRNLDILDIRRNLNSRSVFPHIWECQ